MNYLIAFNTIWILVYTFSIYKTEDKQRAKVFFIFPIFLIIFFEIVRRIQL